MDENCKVSLLDTDPRIVKRHSLVWLVQFNGHKWTRLLAEMMNIFHRLGLGLLFIPGSGFRSGTIFSGQNEPCGFMKDILTLYGKLGWEEIIFRISVFEKFFDCMTRFFKTEKILFVSKIEFSMIWQGVNSGLFGVRGRFSFLYLQE